MTPRLTIFHCFALLGSWVLVAFLHCPSHAATRIYVKLYVDEEEREVDARWKERVRRRIQNASKIMKQSTGISFHLSELGRWLSDNQTTEFTKSLSEFEREVSVGKNEIAIGFTSQYKFRTGRHRLGGTRGPLHTHILIRENTPRAVAAEKLEVLVHELGHFLGAVHSSQTDSVMRPLLGDGRARSRNYQISFDSTNRRIMQIVANEMRHLKVRRFSQLSNRAKRKLRPYYQHLARELPDDPAAPLFLQWIQ